MSASTTTTTTGYKTFPDASSSRSSRADDPEDSGAEAEDPLLKPADDEQAVVVVEAVTFEHNLSFREALRLYPLAVFWSCFVSLGVVMTAFDPQLLGNLYATPQFARDFGYEYKGQYIISAAWQTGLSMGGPAGQVVGALLAGYPMDACGRRRTFAVCVVLTGLCVFIQFFARSLPVLLAGELAGGLVLGSYVVIAPAYASEVCPLALRGHLTSYVNLCFVAGQLLANAVTAATETLASRSAYAIPFALQWVWIAAIVPGMAFVPESPWWLVRRGRLDEAERSLRRLASPGVDVAASLAVIVETDRLEREMASGSGTSYRDCFRGTNLRRTEISVGVYASQVLSGVPLVSYGTYFFQRAGLPTDQAFAMGVGFLAVGFVGTVLSWVLLLRFGRRPIFVAGLAGLAALQLAIGVLDCVPGRPGGVAWAEASLMLAWNLAYDLSVGPICFCIISEVSATRVRSKSIAVCTAAQALLGIAMTVALPYMINPDQGDWRGKVGFLFGGLAALCWAWAYLRLPETSGRTYDELDLLFRKGVPARQFVSYDVDALLAHET